MGNRNIKIDSRIDFGKQTDDSRLSLVTYQYMDLTEKVKLK